MKTLVVTAMAMVSLVASGAAQDQEAQESEPGYVSSYFGPGPGYRVTIESANGVVAILEVPDGVFLSVFGQADPGPGETAFSARRFIGNVTIRTRRADEREEGESNLADEIMQKSPLAMSLEDVTVIVETAEEQG